MDDKGIHTITDKTKHIEMSGMEILLSFIDLELKECNKEMCKAFNGKSLTDGNFKTS